MFPIVSWTRFYILISLTLSLGMMSCDFQFSAQKLRAPVTSSSPTESNLVRLHHLPRHPWLEAFLSLSTRENFEIPSQSTVYQALLAIGLAPQSILSLVAATKDTYDLGQILGGTSFTLQRNYEREPEMIEFKLSALERLSLLKYAGKWVPNIYRLDTEMERVQFSGIVEDSFWQSAVTAGISPNLIFQFAEIFSWPVSYTHLTLPTTPYV